MKPAYQPGLGLIDAWTKPRHVRSINGLWNTVVTGLEMMLVGRS